MMFETIFLCDFWIYWRNPSQFFVAENVLGILDDKYKSLRDAALNKITGYTILSPLIIRADEYGAPTTRTRVFLLDIEKKKELI